MTSEDETEENLGVHWTSPHFYKNNQIFVPRILDQYSTLPEKTADHNAVTLRLDAQMTSDLDWKTIRKEAEILKKNGFFIFWDIYLGLFQRPLDDQTQFLSLCLALEHFRDTLWKDFQDCTFGISLFRGEADFSRCFQWNEAQLSSFKEWGKEKYGDSFESVSLDTLRQTAEGRHLVSLFCRNAVSEYLHLLADRLPDEMLLCLLLDASAIKDPLQETQLLSRAAFDRFHLGVKTHQMMHEGLIWKESSIDKSDCQEFRIGLCLPPVEMEHSTISTGLRDGLQELLKRNIQFKIIPEETLITEWDGLDWMIVASKSLGPQGKRKLQGFCAAGGTCVTIGKPIGLANEIDIASWFADN